MDEDALWELRARGTVVRATTEFFSTRWGCATTRDEWNKREESGRKEEEEKCRRENPEPPRGGILRGPLIIHVEYECYPVGVTPGVQGTPLFR